MPSSTPTTYPYTFVAVWDALQRVLPHLGFQVVAADPTTGVLQLRGGSGSVMSLGENLTVKAGAPDAFHTVVQIESGIRLGIATYARTNSNFDTILRTLGGYLDQHYLAHRAPDAPPVPLPPPPVQQPPVQQPPAQQPPAQQPPVQQPPPAQQPPVQQQPPAAPPPPAGGAQQ